MGNSQNRYAVTRTAHCPALVAKSKTTDNMQTNSSEGITATADHAHHKTTSCFNFSNCSEQQQRGHFEYRKSLLKQVEGSSPAKKPMLRARPASNNNLFSKVRERLIKLNRRSTPVNFGPAECLDAEESHGLLEGFNSNATVVTRSLTDYNLIQFSNEDEQQAQKLPRFGKFTKSPALYDIKQYASQNPQYKISDLLEEEKEICYDDYEEDEEESNSYNESSPSSLDTDQSSTQSINQNQTTCSLHSNHADSTIRLTRPSNFLQSLSTNAPTSLSSPPLSTPPPVPDQMVLQAMDVDDLSFIDDGRSECVTLSSSKSSSMPSILFSSFRCSLTNLNRLIALNSGNQGLADKSSSSATSSSHLARSQTGGSRKKLKLDTESSTFMQQVNQKLLTHARQGKGAREKRARLQRLVATTKSKHSDSCVDLQHAQYNNDNISIFNYIQRAPLASSETTTLSSSTDNLLHVKQYSQISSKKYPLINKLLSDHLYQSDHNNNYF